MAARKKFPARARETAATRKPAPKLLSGGNPRIPLGVGAAPIRAYVAAMPGWKRAVGRRLDALITRTAPGVAKAVKYNSPLYGLGGTWFLSLHCFERYIKVSFFRGTSLKPPPPVASKVSGVRYFHIHETDELDEAQLVRWIRQASKLPGEKL